MSNKKSSGKKNSLYELLGTSNRIDTANFNKSLEHDLKKKYLDLKHVDALTREKIELKLQVGDQEEEEDPPRYLWTSDSYGNIMQLDATNGNVLNDFGQKWYNKRIYSVTSTANSKYVFAGDECGNFKQIDVRWRDHKRLWKNFQMFYNLYAVYT